MSHSDPPARRIQAELVAERHQRFLASQGLRTAQGSFYTPLDVVERMVTLALESNAFGITSSSQCPSVIDPACGTGNFLIVAALQLTDRLVGEGMVPSEAIDLVVGQYIYGIDIDVEALDLCAENLSRLTDKRIPATKIREHLLRANALTTRSANAPTQLGFNLDEDAPKSWLDLFPEVFSGDDPGFDLVVGNPPFLNQLNDATKLELPISTAMTNAHGTMASKMSNPSTVFILAAIALAKANGVIALIQPLSFLATDDASSVRTLLANSSAVDYLWVCTEKVFDADVYVCGVVARIGPHGPVDTRVVTGRDLKSNPERGTIVLKSGTWSSALTLAKGFPRIDLAIGGALEDLCTVSSDFRDQYYGLVGCVADQEEFSVDRPRLATVGLIDPGEFLWGQATTRFAKNTYEHPVVITEKLAPEIMSWVKARQVPKVLVATQTRVIEAWVDTDGHTLPSVPLVTVIPAQQDLWKVAAVLSAPPISLHAADQFLGAGLSPDALKLNGRNLLALPLPKDEVQWKIGAHKFELMQALPAGQRRRESLLDFGVTMCLAYGVSPEAVMPWWTSRLPHR
jgi:methylase of polypeptide subunit release factors